MNARENPYQFVLVSRIFRYLGYMLLLGSISFLMIDLFLRDLFEVLGIAGFSYDYILKSFIAGALLLWAAGYLGNYRGKKDRQASA